MPRMKHEEHGITHVGYGDIEALEAIGWKIYTDEDHEKAIAAKHGKVIITADGQAPAQTAKAESDPAPARRGRPPKV